MGRLWPGAAVTGPGPLLRMLRKDEIGRTRPAKILRDGRIVNREATCGQRAA